MFNRASRRGAMYRRRLFLVLLLCAIVLAACSGSTPTAVPGTISAPTSPAAATGTAATQMPHGTALPTATGTAPSGPLAHTACAADLSGQNVNFYHLLPLNGQLDEFGYPMQAGLDDAAAYVNEHGGI